jgi:hypothetical protein
MWDVIGLQPDMLITRVMIPFNNYRLRQKVAKDVMFLKKFLTLLTVVSLSLALFFLVDFDMFGSSVGNHCS